MSDSPTSAQRIWVVDDDRAVRFVLCTALREAGVRATTAVYPGAAHGYTMADTSMYDEVATERHFTELRGLFGRTLH